MSDIRNERRTFLKVLGAATAAGVSSQPLFSALADPPVAPDEFFVFIHASGGWDVTVGLDPRNEARGIIDPASTQWVDTAVLRNWRDATLDADYETFEILQPRGTNLRFGPAVGNLLNIADRVTVINGLAMNTVSHPDGTFFVSTGRHLAGGRPAGASIDTVMANESGRAQLFPSVSVSYPSAYVGNELDPRSAPLKMASIDSVSRVLTRANVNTQAADRNAVTMMLTQEARDLLARSYHPEVIEQFVLQYESLPRMVREDFLGLFQTAGLQTAQPNFNYRARFQSRGAVNAAFAVEAMKRNVVRCVSFSMGSLDTHGANYRTQPLVQQELFDVVAQLVASLDAAPHPTLRNERLSAHTHILVVSDFCRTPQINMTGGRDHYPNGSALVISPKFRGGFSFGSSDPDQLLPRVAGRFADGMRAVAPPDVLATFVNAFGVNPRKYLRDGDVVRELLRA
ncbi:MAG: DUF1501 domain-containing protein [Myxococcales bacterium]|nr:DUF1501 domain-containing protein [Myxococcales bacterium]